jgi:glycosyltransferase involved in cell wall biosynthesis
MKISVCIATYNGEEYIKEQLASILSQLAEEDEIIISDDNSNDNTVSIIKAFKDERIKILTGQGFNSPIYNFENALRHASGDIIVLSDQDDIWEVNKIQAIRTSFKNETKNVALKMYNGKCIDDCGKVINEDLFKYLHIKEGLMNNIIKNSFIGCNIAFTKELLNYVLPFPKNIPMHDSWLGSNAYIYGNVEFVDEKIFRYRLHTNNYSIKENSLLQKIKWRINLIINLLKRYMYVKLST